MTQENRELMPQGELYTNAYIETWTDINGVKHEEFKFGKLCKRKEDLPDYYEISYARSVHLGAVKIEIKPL